MTYSPGSPGYPPAQSPGSYGVAPPSFAKSDDSESKLQLYLTIAVVALGVAAYLASFGPMFTVSTELSAEPVTISTGGGYAVVAALLAALLAAAGLLPKAMNYTAIVAAIAVLGGLLVILQTLTKSSALSVRWALWLVLAFAVLQAIAAVVAVLLDTGIVRPPTPRPKYDQYTQYGQYGQYGAQPGGYYGQQHTPFGQHGPPQSGYGSQYGGYPSGPSTGGFGAVGPQSGPQQGQQPGPPTPPTGFPSFSPPPSAGSGAGSQAPGNSANHGGSGQGQQPQSPSSSSGPMQS